MTTITTIASGAHLSPEQGACIMEYVSMLAKEPFSDHPQCVCPLLGRFLRNINDSIRSTTLRTELLLPLAPLLLNSVDTSKERARADFLLMWSINKLLPIGLRATDFVTNAIECEKAIDKSQGLQAALNAYRSAYALCSVVIEQAAYSAVDAARIATGSYADTQAGLYASSYINVVNSVADIAHAYKVCTRGDVYAIAVEGLKLACEL